MDVFTLGLENGYRLLLLAIPALFGAVVGHSGLLGDNDRAVDTLNVYALYVGFPALVFVGLLDDRFTLPSSPWFWLTVPVSHGLVVATLVWMKSTPRGTLALIGLFGNVAYLGLPLVIGMYGESTAGVASLIVAIHVAISVSVGPYLVRAWSTDSGEFEAGKLLRQPLLWAPVLGLAARFLPVAAAESVETALRPLANSAAPVALFLLGLYIYTRRAALFGRVPWAWSHIAVRMVFVPSCTAAVSLLGVHFGMLDFDHARVFILLSGMPAAITTFSIAHDAGTGSEVVAATIVRTTLLAVLSLPVLATAIAALT